MKARPIVYWTATAIIAGETLAGGVTDLIQGRESVVAGRPVVDVVTQLGYPVYVLKILGVLKLAGAAVLFAPRLPAEGVGVRRRDVRADGRGRLARAAPQRPGRRDHVSDLGHVRARVVGAAIAEPHARVYIGVPVRRATHRGHGGQSDLRRAEIEPGGWCCG
jgi:hypothetical protein